MNPMGGNSILPQEEIVRFGNGPRTDHRHDGTLSLRPNAYKLKVGGVSPRCGIKQIHEGGIGPRHIPKADNSFLGKD